MPDIGMIDPKILLPAERAFRRGIFWQRPLFLVLVGVAAVAGVLATPAGLAAQAVAQAGPELTHLLRAMAGLKALAALGLVGLVFWRLAVAATTARFVGYILACGAMASGPGLIWDMAHLKLGAVLLHAGLLASAVLLWRDPATAARLSAIIARRRAALRA